jgi:hypothetical protein
MRLSVALWLMVASACTGGGGQICSDVQCNAPTCCGGACSTDADCCRGTVCSTSGRCIPESCVACGELGCLVDFAACDAVCIPPDRCGEPCANDAECGQGARCEAFPSGSLLCVPDAFDDQCRACGAGGCTFSPASCEVSCTEPPAIDAGTTTPDGGAPAAPSCTACCEPCQTDADCCAGAYCGESAMGGLFCFPVECRTCTYGCTFTCPG